MVKSYDVIVLGLGAMGSAAAYQLAKRGARVLGLDRFAPPHTAGSTHGDTRVTRQAIGEGIAYTPLALRSNEIWRELEAQTGHELYVATGGLIISEPDSTAGIHGTSDFLKQTVELARQYNIPHQLLTTDEICRRFPQFKLHGSEIGYYEPGAGFLRPERCVGAQLQLAANLGGDIHTNERVTGYELNGSGVRVFSDKDEYIAERLIISAGPWVTEFLDDTLKQFFKVYRQVLYWFDVQERYDEFALGNFPIFIYEFGTAGDGIYGFPAIDGHDSGIKIAAEDYDVTTTPDLVSRAVTSEETQDMYARRIRPYLNGVDHKCLRAVTCLYTVTPDFHFVIDFHPDMPQVSVASPCSGHGFKHSAAIGEALAELATDGRSRLDISSFGLRRFGH